MRRLFGVLFLLAASCFATLVAGEVALRAMGFYAPIWYRPDRVLGWSLRPGAKGLFTYEGRGAVLVSPAGFRDRSHDLEKPAHTYRIALLGDSFAEAMQVDFESTFWWQLENKLDACAPHGTDVEVMNFGVSGYGTAQESLQLENTAIKYQPDLVLLAFTNGNDLPDNSKRLSIDDIRPFYTLKNGQLVLDDSFVRTAEFKKRTEHWLDYYRAASDKLRLVQLLHQAKKGYEAMSERSVQNAAAPLDIPGIEPGTDVRVLAPPRDAAWRDAWAVTEALIGRMNDFSRQHGARFVLTTVSFAAQVHPDEKLRRSLEAELGVPDLFYIEHRMEALGNKDGFPVIPLAYEMQKRAQAEHVYFHGFRNVGLGIGHWNEAGHRAAAEILAPALCRIAFGVPVVQTATQKSGGASLH